jgi:hypothetical protein
MACIFSKNNQCALAYADDVECDGEHIAKRTCPFWR